MATFIGASQGGLLGAFLATLSVALPAFIIILVIAAVISDLLKYAGVNAFRVEPQFEFNAFKVRLQNDRLVAPFRNVRVFHSVHRKRNRRFAPGIKREFREGFGRGNAEVAFAVILAILAVIHIVWRKLRKKRPSPILMILISAGLGLAFYS